MSSGRSAQRIGGVVLAMLLAHGATAAPIDPVTLTPQERQTQAKLHYELGESLYRRGEYDRAAASFEEGYRLAPQPAFLFDLAMAHRNAGHPGAALAAFRRYLAAVPRSAERPEVERNIVELERALRAAPEAPAVEAPRPPAPPRHRGLAIGLGVTAGVLVAAGVTVGLVLGLPRSGPRGSLGTFDVAP